MKKCPYCAEEIQDAAIVCRFCGHDLKTGQPRRTETTLVKAAPSNGIAAVLSLFIPGAGQMYKGHVGAGILWLIGTVFGYLAFVLPGLIIHLICIFHAASVAPVSEAPAPAQVRSAGPRPQAAPNKQWSRTDKRLIAALFIGVPLAGVIFVLVVMMRYEGVQEVSRHTEPVPESKSAAPSTPAPPALVTLQVATFKDKTTADAMVRRLKAKGLDAYAEANMEARVIAVRVGKYKTRADVENDLAKIRLERLSPIVIPLELPTSTRVADELAAAKPATTPTEVAGASVKHVKTREDWLQEAMQDATLQRLEATLKTNGAIMALQAHCSTALGRYGTADDRGEYALKLKRAQP